MSPRYPSRAGVPAGRAAGRGVGRYGDGVNRDPGTTVGDLSEDGLLAEIFPRLPFGRSTVLGPGDDAAVVVAADGRVVVSTDVLVEGWHFRRDWSGGLAVGRRAAAQNLADIAAMGGRPTAL